MPFRERTRQFYKKIVDDKCQHLIYSEDKGFHTCDKPVRDIHHILPEGELLDQGEDSERTEGLPLCAKHHTRNLGDEEYSDDFAFHTDAGRAYQQYGEWKRQALHMETITGKKYTVPSPFAQMSQEHARLRQEGERYHNGTPELDEYYRQEIRNKTTAYLAESGEKKPQTTPHPRYDPSKKVNWYDEFFKPEEGYVIIAQAILGTVEV